MPPPRESARPGILQDDLRVTRDADDRRVDAEGTRTTTIWAVGTVGNDREIVATTERWFSKQLQVELLTKTSDPRSGDSIAKLADISLVEPDPALFMPPPDYTIKDVPPPAPNP